MTYYTYVSSPLGLLLLTSDGSALTGLYMNEHKHGTAISDNWILRDDAPPFPEARTQLEEYFVGTRTQFDLPLAADGTAFQREVWAELETIPYGETISYGELARRVGRPRGAQAVGAANGRNPISIIVPCHRVVGADGALVGYGGGLERKAALLAHEAKNRSDVPRQLALGVI
ncbi:MAG: methylated-DNA--[protein]-cysteine S-methyltransferase [Chloroflexota bacterium]|nr:methylated-DNA--[protein]-cysteine S-methyltransferase [Chloroflexota bacterium]